MSPKNIPKEELLNKVLIIRFKEFEFQELKQFCKEREITISEFVRNLIKNAIKRAKK
ncbi:hypothetical protein [Spiroplasma endosymbiont of Nebria brevicollis]|uniref:hypothetical protein n=1 Tax=Spiroplasma endosymbiont of Nebria brevicollis TaxID=3066284 RepID=UPI00313CB9F4